MSKSFQTPTAIGFGANYFQNFGDTVATKLHHVLQGEEEEDEEQELMDQDFDDDKHHNLTVQAHMFANNSPPPWDVQEDPLVEIATSSGSTMFLTQNGKIYTVGTLHGRVRTSITRTIIQLPLMAVQIAAGRHFCLARMEGGLAVCSWGAGHFGQLGLGDARPYAEHPTVMEGLLPHAISSPVAEVVAGAWHGMALTEGGQVWAWGCNRSNQCGRKKADPTASSAPPTMVTPQLVPLEKTIVKLAAGKAHSVALDRNGSVYCWGASNYSQCGGVARRRSGIAPPILVEALAKVQIVDIAAGDLHTLALTGGGRVFAWGGGAEGQLGAGSWCTLMNPKPKLVGDLDFVAIQAGVEWKAKQRKDGGKSAFTAAGEVQPSPTSNSDRVTSSPHVLASVPRITSIHAAGNHSVACSSSGHVYSWGSNDVGQLGVPTPDRDTLAFVEPGQPLPKTTTLRQFHTQSFDSSHNLSLPQRVDCISGYHITSVALNPTSMWCIGTKRPDDDKQPPVIVGRTLYECQETKRRRSLEKRRKSASSGSASASQSDPNSNSPASQKASLDTEVSSTMEALEVSQSQDSFQDSMSSIIPSGGEDSPRQKSRRRFTGPLKMIKKLSSRSSNKSGDSSQISEAANEKGRKFFS